MFWNKKEKEKDVFIDAEIDIENLPIAAIERNNAYGYTVFTFAPPAESDYAKESFMDDWTIRCTIEQHNNFVARFRKTLGLSVDK